MSNNLEIDFGFKKRLNSKKSLFPILFFGQLFILICVASIIYNISEDEYKKEHRHINSAAIKQSATIKNEQILVPSEKSLIEKEHEQKMAQMNQELYEIIEQRVMFNFDSQFSQQMFVAPFEKTYAEFLEALKYDNYSMYRANLFALISNYEAVNRFHDKEIQALRKNFLEKLNRQIESSNLIIEQSQAKLSSLQIQALRKKLYLAKEKDIQMFELMIQKLKSRQN